MPRNKWLYDFCSFTIFLFKSTKDRTLKLSAIIEDLYSQWILHIRKYAVISGRHGKETYFFFILKKYLSVICWYWRFYECRVEYAICSQIDKHISRCLASVSWRENPRGVFVRVMNLCPWDHGLLPDFLMLCFNLR